MVKKVKKRSRRKHGRNHKRREERLNAQLPVTLSDAHGITRDISASGMFFETDAEYTVGSPIELLLNLDMPWGKVKCSCRGKIVRLEPHNHKIGIAVQFMDAIPQPGRKSVAKKPGARRARSHARPRRAR